MTLSITIKKIISVVLLSCVVIGAMPIQMFAQAAGNSNMSGFTGWDTVAANAKPSLVKVNRTFAGFTSFDYTTDLSGARPGTKDNGGVKPGTNTDLSWETYYALEQATGGLKNPSDGGSAFGKSSMFSVATNDGKVAYYYKAGTGNPVLVAYAAYGKVYVPPAGFVTKDLTPLDPNNKDTNTQQGFMNGVDAENNQPAGSSYSKLNNVEERRSLEQTQDSNNKRLNEINQSLADDDAKDTLSASERSTLETERDEITNANKNLSSRAQAGNNAAQSNVISMDACPGDITEIGKFFTSPACIVTLLAIVANAVLKLSAFVLYWTGNLFDYSIEIAVNSAQFLKQLNIIEPTWALVRDALNMTFIFILLFVAVQILLGKNGYTVKGSIARLVLIAILMNFSLFAAKIMVDTSNIISLNIYESIKLKGSTSPNRGNVSERIMSTLGLSGIYNFGAIFDNNTVPGCGGAPGTVLTVGVFGSILLIITSLAFLLVATLFFLRMLNIILLFVTSPIWVWGYVMQNGYFKTKTNWWMGSMWHVMKFPVMFMLMMYVALAMFAQLNIAQISKGGERTSFLQLICSTDTSQGASADLGNKLPLILNFILVIASIGGIIAYSAKNAGTGGLIGTDKLASNIGNRFNDIQKKFTTGAAQGVYNKSTGAALAVGKGAIALGGKAKDATLTLAKDAVRNKLDKRNNKIADTLASRAVSGNYTTRQSERLAARAEKLRTRKIFGETEKEAEKRRNAPTIAASEALLKAQAEEFKVLNEKAWKKKNPGGTSAQYKEYLKGKVSLIERSQLGGLENTNIKDKDGNTVTTQDSIRNNDNIYDESIVDIKDASGNVIGQETVTKLNEEKLFNNIKKAREQHAESGDLLKNETGKKREFFKTKKAEARIKTHDDALKAHIKTAGAKQGKVETVKRKKLALEKLNEKLKGAFPTDLDSLDLAKVKDYDSEIASYLRQSNIIKRKGAKEIKDAKDTADEMRARNEMKTDLEHLRIEAEAKIEKKKTEAENTVIKLTDEIKTLEEEV